MMVLPKKSGQNQPEKESIEMATMKQLWFVDDQKIELRDVDIPAVGRDMVKVKVAYVALCATDIHMVTMGILNAKPPMLWAMRLPA